MGVARIPVGQGLNAFNLLNVERGMSKRTYTSAAGLTQPNTTGGSVVDDGTTSLGGAVSPKIGFGVGAATPGANEVAEVIENFTQDPYINAAEPLTKGQVYWGLPIYASGYFVPNISFNLAAGCYFGLSIGGVLGSGILGALGAQTSLNLRFDMFSDVWHAVVSNKWASVGHKVFDINLGSSANLGVFRPAIGGGTHFEIFYTPNQSVEFFVDGKSVLFFTDGSYGGLLGGIDTPLRDIYNNRNAGGSTSKGISAYGTTGPVGASQQHLFSVLDLRSVVMGIA